MSRAETGAISSPIRSEKADEIERLATAAEASASLPIRQVFCDALRGVEGTALGYR